MLRTSMRYLDAKAASQSSTALSATTGRPRSTTSQCRPGMAVPPMSLAACQRSFSQSVPGLIWHTTDGGPRFPRTSAVTRTPARLVKDCSRASAEGSSTTETGATVDLPPTPPLLPPLPSFCPWECEAIAAATSAGKWGRGTEPLRRLPRSWYCWRISIADARRSSWCCSNASWGPQPPQQPRSRGHRRSKRKICLTLLVLIVEVVSAETKILFLRYILLHSRILLVFF